MTELLIIQTVWSGNCSNINNKNQIILRFRNLAVIKNGLT